MKKTQTLSDKNQNKAMFLLQHLPQFFHMKGKNALNFLAQAHAMIWPGFIVLIALTSLAHCALLTAHPVVLSHSYLSQTTV